LSSDWQLGVGTGSTTKINTVCTGYCRVNPDHCGLSADNFSTDVAVYNGTDIEEIIENEPNTALLSFILMFGTFMIAYGLKQFRNSHYFGRTVNYLYLTGNFRIFYITLATVLVGSSN
jgi:hypothetical protein